MISRPNIVSKIGIVPDTNHGGRRPARPTHITDHHVVGDAGAALAEAQKPSRQVSFTYTIASDGTIYQALDNMIIPFTDGNYSSNKISLTIEHAGGLPSVPYTEAMYRSSIHLHAWLRQEFGIPEGNIRRHRDVSINPTACPGGLDVERIRRESTNLLKGDDMTKIDEEGVRILAVGVLNRPEPLTTTPDLRGHVGGDALAKLKEFWYSPEGKAANAWQQKAPGLIAEQARTIDELNKKIADLADNPTEEQFAEVQKAAAEAEKAKAAAEDALEKLRNQVEQDVATGNAFTRWIGDQLNKILGKG